jgi:hypothetical protein
VFTALPERLPVAQRKFKALQASVKQPGVRFVSISVDPAHDTPRCCPLTRRGSGPIQSAGCF